MEVGIKAPDFSCSDHRDKTFSLADHRGRKVLLSFHPLAWTPVCAKQMQSLGQQAGTFAGLETEAVGISVDSVPTKSAWADHLNITATRLLSDFWPHGGIAQRFRLFRETNGFSERANVVVDRKGNIAFYHIHDIKLVPDLDPIIEVLQGLP